MIGSVNDHDDLIQPMKVPVIDVSLLSQDSCTKPLIIKEIQEACQKSRVFHVINHGISELVIHEALEVNQKFFDSTEMMMKVGSADLFSPVKLIRFQRSVQGSDLLQRDFVRLFANPLEDFVEFWPRNPIDYREKMGTYTMEVRRLGIQLFGAILESLNLGAGATNLQQNFKKGMHMLMANNYSPHLGSSIRIGTPPHSDHSIFTILCQSSPGLQVLDMADSTWKSVPILEGSLQVLVGDHLEVLSNGIYKSVLHCAIPTSSKARMSLSSFHSFEIDEIIEPAVELTSENCPKKYKGSSARDIIKGIYSGEVDRLIDRLKI